MDSLYLNIATDGVLSSLLVPLRSPTTFFAMKSFGGYDAATLQIAAAIAAGSAALGHCINWGLGWLLLVFAKSRQLKFLHKGYLPAQKYFATGGIITLLFSWVTLFSLFSVIAGFLGVRLRYALPLLLIGQAGYFGYYL
ncbi:MAG: hypothetical protein EBR02_05640 [Alphaproteobacteria bacterium]|nr:hypothetical protein [Alphaproteobacteria bacterium]